MPRISVLKTVLFLGTLTGLLSGCAQEDEPAPPPKQVLNVAVDADELPEVVVLASRGTFPRSSKR